MPHTGDLVAKRSAKYADSSSNEMFELKKKKIGTTPRPPEGVIEIPVLDQTTQAVCKVIITVHQCGYVLKKKPQGNHIHQSVHLVGVSESCSNLTWR